MELRAGRMDSARKLLEQSMAEVPLKMKAVLFLEMSRLEEYSGDGARARSILIRAKRECQGEWKVFLEAVLLEIRCSQFQSALQEATAALETHPGAGRLWAVLMQLKQCEGEQAQLVVFRRALQEVPKSGEVWCEGARMCLNPTSPYFDLCLARKYLANAVQFTPQYGDSFVENLRLEMLERGSGCDPNTLHHLCVNAEPNYGACLCPRTTGVITWVVIHFCVA
jgi:hypothetical protein